MSFRCCSLIQLNALNFNGDIGSGEKKISLCCESKPNKPSIAFKETAEETLRSFLGECMAVNAECRFIGDEKKRFFTSGCADCTQFQEMNLPPNNGRINYVNLSMYPAPCQSHCIYCNVWKNEQDFKSEKAKAAYEMMFDVLDLAQESGIIAEDATWQISSGEIAIHPYHDRIMKLVKGKKAIFYTNAMKFDDDVAQNLYDNPSSAINLSIDCGTPKTWEKIKGINNFEKVTENLTKYFGASSKPGQITLKYIILPGINDIYEDFESVIEIMKILKVDHLTIARDTRYKYNMDSDYKVQMIGAAAYLLAMCHKNGITNNMFTFSTKERDEAIKQAVEILNRGLI